MVLVLGVVHSVVMGSTFLLTHSCGLWWVFNVGNEARTAGKGQERVSIPGGGKNQAGRGSFLPVDSVSKFETTMSWKHLLKHV